MSNFSNGINNGSNTPVIYQTTDANRPTAPLAVGSLFVSQTSNILQRWDGSGWVTVGGSGTGSVTSVNGKTGVVVLTTTDIAEGTNLYYTDGRARAALSAGTAITYNNTTGQISVVQDVSSSATPIFAGVQANGSAGVVLKNSGGTNVAEFGPANTTNANIVGSLTIGGNLIVSGSTGTINGQSIVVGTGATNRVAFFNGSNILSSSGTFTWNGTTLTASNFLTGGTVGFGGGSGGNNTIYHNNAGRFIIQSDFDVITIQGGINDANKRQIDFLTGSTQSAYIDISGFFWTTATINTNDNSKKFATTEYVKGQNYVDQSGARSAISAGTGINYNSGTGVISSTITQYTDALARAAISLTTSGTSGAATYNSSTGVLNIPQYQSVLTNPVTGTGTSGQVAFWNGTNTLTGSNNLFWDIVNNRLGINTNTPGQPLVVNKTGSSNYLIVQGENNSGYDIAQLFTDGTNNVYAGMMRGTTGLTGAYTIFTGGAARVNVLNSGFIGVNTTAPAGWIHVVSDLTLNRQAAQFSYLGVAGMSISCISTSSQPYIQYTYSNGNIVVANGQLNVNMNSGTSLIGTLTGTGTNVGSQWKFVSDNNTTGAFIGIAAGESTGDAVFSVGANKKLVFGVGSAGTSRAVEIESNTVKIFETAGNTSNWVRLGAVGTGTNTWLFGAVTTGSGFTLKTDTYLNATINGTAYKLALIN